MAKSLLNAHPANWRCWWELTLIKIVAIARAGCITDVEMQQHLLIHRFGFNKNDVHILTDAQATREGILGAFDEYLIGQGKPGDVVVFHFFGHGSRVDDSPECD